MPFCPHCGKEVSEGVSFCPDCGQELKKGFTSEERQLPKKGSGDKMVVWGYVCGILALFVFPIGFGIAGVVIGIINITKNKVGHGIAQIVIAVTLGILGAVWGAIVWGG